MRILVYVEGPADRAALETLLRDLISQAGKRRIGISFIPLGGKVHILTQVGLKAANHLADQPEDWVFALPDLYPMAEFDGTENAHRSFLDLEALLRRRFVARCDALKLPEERRERFRVHCLKHDLEALILAAPDALRARLGTRDGLKDRWRLPVEDQNDAQPPKRVVEALFSQYKRKRYLDTDDGPWIMAKARLEEVEKGCKQRFAPFVRELRELLERG